MTAARREGVSVDGRPVAVAEMGDVDAQSGAEREAWFTAMDFYRRDAISRDFLLNSPMYGIKGQLVAIQDPDWDWPAAR